MQDFLRGKFAQAADKGKFLEVNSEMLDRFPALKQRMEASVGAEAVAVRTAATGKARQGVLTGSAVERFAGAKVGAEFQDAVLGARDAAGTAQSLARRAARDKTGVATRNLKASVFDYMIDEAKITDGGLSGKKIRAVLEDRRAGAAVREILDPEDLVLVAQVAKEFDQIQASRGRAGAGGIIDDKVNSVIAFIGTTLGARGGAKLGAGTSGAGLKMAGEASGRVRTILNRMTNNTAERLVRDSFDDRDLFKALFIDASTPAGAKLVENQIGIWLVAQTGQAVSEARGRPDLAEAVKNAARGPRSLSGAALEGLSKAVAGFGQ
jgi:hypothetical protein